MGRRLRLANPTSKPSKAQVITVDRAVAARALALADGDSTRIKILSPTSVLVRNRGSKR